MDLYEVMRTTFAARDFSDDPVPEGDVVRILENARFAPSGGNRQGWKVVVVRDEKTKDALGGIGLALYDCRVGKREDLTNVAAYSTCYAVRKDGH